MYKFGNPIRNKIFNYKKTVESICIEDPPSLTTCACRLSEFKDPNHGHIVTGDLRIDRKPQNWTQIESKIFQKTLIGVALG